MDDLRLDIEFILNDDQVKKDTATMKADISGVGQTAEDVSKKVSAQVKTLFSDSAREIEAWKKSLSPSGSGAITLMPTLDELKKRLEEVTGAQQTLKQWHDQGSLSADKYAEQLEKLTRAQAELESAIAGNGTGPQGAAQQKQLTEQEKLIGNIADEYRGLLDEGLYAYDTLSVSSRMYLEQLLNARSGLQQVSLAQRDLNKRYEQGKITATQYARAQAALTTQEQKFRQEIKRLNEELKKQNEALDKNAGKMSVLDKSVLRTGRSFNSFAYSAVSGLNSLAYSLPSLIEDIITMRAEAKALNAEGKKAPGIWQQLGKSLLSWQTLLLAGITLIINYRKEIGAWLEQLFRGKEALDVNRRAQEALKKAYEDTKYKKVIEDVLKVRTALELARDGVIDKTKALKQYNETLGDALGEANSLEVAEQRMIDKAPEYVKAMLYKAAAAYQASEAAKQLAENARKGFDLDKEIEKSEEKQQKADATSTRPGATRPATPSLGGLVSIQTASLRAQRAELDEEARKTEEVNQKIITKLQKQAEEIAKAAGIDLDPEKTKTGIDAILRQRQSLLDKIAALDREYARKQFTRDEEELQALRDKFDRVRELIERFNNDPKNKAARIDITGLGDIQSRAEEDLLYRQATRRLQKELEEQKQLFEDFEEYKKQFGITKAKEEFAARIGEYENYLDYLRKKAEENAEAFSAVEDGTATGGQQERVNLLDQQAREENRARAQRFQEQLAALLNYEAKRNKIIEDYQQQRLRLVEQGYQDEVAVLDEKHKQELAELDTAEIEKLQSYKELYKGIEMLSASAAKKVIQDAKDMLQQLRREHPELTELIDDIQRKITKLEGDLTTRTQGDIMGIVDDLFAITNSMSALAQLSGQFGDNMGQALQVIGQMAQQIAKVVQAIGQVVKESGKSSGNGWVAIAGAVVELIGSIWSAIDAGQKRQRAVRERYLQDLKDYYAQALSGEIEYQQLLRQREMLLVQQGKSSYQAIISQLDLLKSQVPEIEEAYDRIFSALQGEEYIAGKGYRHGTLFRKAKAWDIMASLQGADYDRLEQLYLQGKLKDQAKADFEALRALREELEQAGLDVEELQRQLNEMLTGTTADQLSSALTDLFANGKLAAADLGRSFEDIMRTAIRNTFQYRYLEEQMMPFYDALTDLMQSGTPTQGQIDKLRQQYEELGAAAAEQWKQLQEVTGVDLSGKDNTTGLAGAIRRELTEQTGSELAGITRGQYDITKRLYQVAEQHFMLEKRNNEIFIQQLSYQARIDENTRNTVTELKLAVIELKEIKKNTKSQTSRDLGRG